MKKKEFDFAIAAICAKISSRRNPGLCPHIEDISPAAKDLFVKVFYKERPTRPSWYWKPLPGVDDAWLTIIKTSGVRKDPVDYEASERTRHEFLYRFWDYCVERELYKEW